MFEGVTELKCHIIIIIIIKDKLPTFRLRTRRSRFGRCHTRNAGLYKVMNDMCAKWSQEKQELLRENEHLQRICNDMQALLQSSFESLQMMKANEEASREQLERLQSKLVGLENEKKQVESERRRLQEMLHSLMVIATSSQSSSTSATSMPEEEPTIATISDPIRTQTNDNSVTFGLYNNGTTAESDEKAYTLLVDTLKSQFDESTEKLQQNMQQKDELRSGYEQALTRVKNAEALANRKAAENKELKRELADRIEQCKHLESEHGFTQRDLQRLMEQYESVSKRLAETEQSNRLLSQSSLLTQQTVLQMLELNKRNASDEEAAVAVSTKQKIEKIDAIVTEGAHSLDDDAFLAIIEDYKRQYEQMRLDKEGLSEELASLRAQLEAKTLASNEGEPRLKQLEHENQQLEIEQRQLSGELRSINEQLSLAREQMHTLATARLQLFNGLDSLYDTCSELHTLTNNNNITFQ